MGYWNYCVCEQVLDDGSIYHIHEMYFDDSGDIQGVTENPITPMGETLEELKRELSRMLDTVLAEEKRQEEEDAGKLES